MPWVLFAVLGVVGVAFVDDTARRAHGTAKTLSPALVIGSLAALVWAWKK